MAAGSINITSNSVFDHPAIDPAFYTTAFDIGTAIQAVKTLQTLLATAPFKGKLGPPAVNLTSDAQVEAYIRSGATTVKHPVASARISKTTDQGGVVGPDLTVKKVKGVRVVDASIFVCVFLFVN
jgi:choline dehydrogenase